MCSLQILLWIIVLCNAAIVSSFGPLTLSSLYKQVTVDFKHYISRCELDGECVSRDFLENKIKCSLTDCESEFPQRANSREILNTIEYGVRPISATESARLNCKDDERIMVTAVKYILPKYFDSYCPNHRRDCDNINRTTSCSAPEMCSHKQFIEADLCSYFDDDVQEDLNAECLRQGPICSVAVPRKIVPHYGRCVEEAVFQNIDCSQPMNLCYAKSAMITYMCQGKKSVKF